MFFSRNLVTSAVFGGALLGAAPAWALDGEAFAKALSDAAQAQGILIGYDSATVDGVDVVVSGMTFGLAAMVAEGSDTTAEVSDEVRFENVQELDGGGYIVGRVGRADVGQTFPKSATNSNEVQYSIGEWGIEGLKIAGESAAPELKGANAGLFYDRMFIENFALVVDGKDAITLENAQSLSEIDGERALIDASMDGFVFDLTTVDEPEMTAWREGTGYDEIRATYVAQGSWDLASGELDAPTNTLTLENMGQLNIDMNLGGYTPQFVDSLQGLTKDMNSGDEQRMQAASMQVMGLVSQLTFGRFVVKFQDGGMTDNLLEYYAAENGATRAELVAQANGMAPLLLGQLQAPELQAEVADALKTFLNDPQSMTISLSPDAPVPFPVLMGAAMSSPAELVRALNASVTANQAGAAQ